MRYIEAIDECELSDTSQKLFLAGGITNCPDWQQEMRFELRKTDFTLLNPRRADFPIDDPSAALDQIEWEYNMLRRADKIMFWFPKETVCPIVLYELGAWSMSNKPIFVGVHPGYVRRQDVEIQTGLARPNVKINYSIAELANTIVSFV